MTVQRRLTLAFLSLLTLLLGALIAVEQRQLGAFLDDAAGVRVRAQARPIIDGLLAAPDDLPMDELASRLATDLTSADTGAVVVDADGDVLATAAPGTIGAGPPPVPSPAALARAFGGERSVDVVGEGPDGPQLAALVPLPGAVPARAVIVLGTSLREERDVVRDLLVLAVSGLAALVAAGWLLGTLLIRRALRPLRDIATATRGIADGDLGRRVDDDGPKDEIGDLARSVNDMAASLEEAFAAVSASENRMRSFVADASHELRTPLTALGGYVDVLVRGGVVEDREATTRLLVGLRREIRRMQRLVEDLLLLARLDAGAAIFPRPTELTAVATAVLDEVTPLAGDRRLRIDAPGPVVALVDPDRAHQLLLNLATNAIRHTSAHGQVTIGLGAAGGETIVSVTDDGEGMDEATRLVAFERFHHGPAGGAGLGLAIVASIAASHGGRVALVSHPGRGTIVTAWLPQVEGRST